jgi:hypothetical protein
MAFGKPKAKKVKTEHLPGPIATSYRRIFTRHNPDVERLMFVLDTAETTARFLASVVVCILRELASQGKLELPLVDIGDPRMRLKKPSFGLWMEILREGTRRLRGNENLFAKDAARSLAMELCSYVFNENQKTKGRPYADLDAIVVIRNKVYHPAEKLDLAALCAESELLLNRSLEALAFFENFTPYVVKQINLRRRRMTTSDYEHQCFLLQGEIDFPTAESDNRNWHTETNEVLIYLDETSYLNLDPLFVYLHADEIDKSKVGSDKKRAEVYPGLYSFAGCASKSAGIVVDYMPCAGSSKPFKTSNQVFRDPHLTGSLNNGIEELMQLLGKPPEPGIVEPEPAEA